MRFAPRLLLLTVLPALVAGCAAEGSFPSLAPRPVEFADGDRPVPPCIPGADTAAPEPSPPPAAETEADPVLLARIEQLRLTAREGDSAFDQAIAEAAHAVSSAGASGSDTWIAAQVAVSEAEIARTPTTTALADLTALALEESTESANPLDQRAIEEATDDIRGLADRQTTRLDDLKASLSDL
jgi:hypothetical protein